MSRSGTFHWFVLIAGFAIAVAVARPAAAADSVTLLDGNHPDEAADIVGAAAASPSQPLTMHLTMAIRNRAELDRLLAAQQDPSSPEYHRWLTPDEFTARFGPTEADLAHVTTWLKKRGFTVKTADAATREISFTGSVDQAQNVFAVRIAATADGRLYSNTTDPTVPADIAPLIESFRGLDNLLHSAPMVHRVSNNGSSASSPDAMVDGLGPNFGPQDIYTFYDESSLNLDGSGNGCIGVVEDSDIDKPGADAFDTAFDLPALTSANFSTSLVDGTNPGQTGDELETMVDVLYSHSIAPGSSIRIYLGDPNNTKSSAILDGIHAAITEKSNSCSAISISFGFCGGSKGFYKAQNTFFAQAAAQGQSVFVATGDDGSAGLKLNNSSFTCVTGTSKNVNELAASPHVTAIGGTEFTPVYDSSHNDIGSVAESVWNDESGATGGGESKFFKKPGFQKGLIKKDKNRDLPDISFGASAETPGFFYGGNNPSGAPVVRCCVGGTSVGAPAWAGISQLISQMNGARIGNLNARIYQLGAENEPATTGIRDVTSGSNGYNGVAGFSATSGFDKASGWGTVDMGVFVPAFLGQ
jgi:subtilase family serine protease